MSTYVLMRILESSPSRYDKGLLIADEVRPESLGKRILNGLIRFPLVMITYLLTQTTTSAVKNLPQRVEKAGLLIESVRLNRIESFIELVARKREEGGKLISSIML